MAKFIQDSNRDAKAIVIVGDHEFELPDFHCGGYEVTYYERWDKTPGAYRCTNCLQRFRLRHRPGFVRPYSLYD
jgi:hypothetical protein